MRCRLDARAIAFTELTLGLMASIRRTRASGSPRQTSDLVETQPRYLAQRLASSSSKASNGSTRILASFFHVPATIQLALARRNASRGQRVREEEAKPWRRALILTGQAAEIDAIAARLDVDAIYEDAMEPT